MSFHGAMDAIAAKAETVTGIKRCYASGASAVGVSNSIRPIPQSIDDGPVGVVWPGSATAIGGNDETINVDMRLDIWVRATNAGYAYATLAPFYDSVPTAFRSDMDLGGQVDRCQFAGWDELETETINQGQVYLVLPIRLDTLITRQAHDATI